MSQSVESQTQVTPANPDPVETLWASLINAYGSRFLAQYTGIVDLEPVKADWSARMAGVRVGAVKWALENLPEKPPNAIEFRNLCRQWVPPSQPRLKEPDSGKPTEAMKEVWDRIRAPKPPTGEPEQVTLARQFITNFGGRKQVTYAQSQHLGWCRGVVQRYENSQASLAAMRERMDARAAAAAVVSESDSGASGMALMPASIYAQGRQACASGVAKGENPYPEGSKGRPHWSLGWQAEFDAMPPALRNAALARWVKAPPNAED